jgi:hypothetical protein
MNRDEFISQLRATANELKPLTEAVPLGSLVRNGNEYAKASTGGSPDPYALAWFSVLLNIAELLERQEGSISREQTDYLNRLLFGGMGSFSDLSIDSRTWGNLAEAINDRLMELRKLLYASFSAD